MFQLMDMNERSIRQKSKLAEKTVNNAVFWIAVTGTICVLIVFDVFVNLPSNIANPVRPFKESIMQIANKNCSERVHFENNSEFGEVAKSFNSMAQKPEENGNCNLAELMIEKWRVESLIEKMHNPIIGLDENMKVIFAN